MVSVMMRRNVELCDDLHCNAIAERVLQVRIWEGTLRIELQL
jgi:hypothetical protein